MAVHATTQSSAYLYDSFVEKYVWKIFIWKIRDRKQRTDMAKYSFVNRTVENWNQLFAEALGTLSRKANILRVRQAIINGVKWKE